MLHRSCDGDAAMTEIAQRLARTIDEAWTLMDAIGRDTADPPPGITRPAFGDAEQRAMEAVTAFAQAQGLVVERDGFGNHHILLPGLEPGPAVAAGSHLDSVPNGGNFDGLAGAAAAVAVLAAVAASGVRTRRPLRAVLMRGEESPWFGTAYLGSRLLLGRSPFSEIGALVRRDSGRTLAEHLRALGYTPGAAPVLDASTVACFFELHIEQGPLLIEQNAPVGIATASRGNIRHPWARCRGAYAHSAALPRKYRRDAVLAVAELALELDAFWAAREAAGDDNFVATMGQFSTDPAQHAMTKVAGEVSFTLNLGATAPATLDAARAALHHAITRIETERRVTFDLGAEVCATPAPYDAALIGLLENSAAASGIASLRMPTVGHDAAMFALSGIPAAVLLVRNANGSHNPDETMLQADFAAGVSVLAGAMLAAAGTAEALA
jgi:N-carbamoyl-L-amino-acid hydrolase